MPDPSRYRWPAVVVIIAAIALFAYLWTLREAREVAGSAARAVHAVGDEVGEVAGRFLTGTITTTFIEAIPEVRGTGLGNLELATVELTEILTTTDERTVLWDSVSLGETLSEIRVPVTYRYHLRLADAWQLEVSGGTCLVLAPEIRPSLPPAIDTRRMTKRSDNGWLRFNADDQLAELERSLTPTLSAYAGDPRHIDLIRDEARATVAAFVQSWLLREDQWREDRFRAIVVRFPDEDRDDSNVARPTIRLE